MTRTLPTTKHRATGSRCDLAYHDAQVSRTRRALDLARSNRLGAITIRARERAWHIAVAKREAFIAKEAA